MTTTQAEAAPSPESPATVPTLQDHAAKLAPLGWTGREAEWLALVALHSGVVYALTVACSFLVTITYREPARNAFVHGRLSRKTARVRGRAARSSPAAHAPFY